MTNKRNGTLYVGVTSDLKRRVYEHKNNVIKSCFTAKYGCNTLVYYKSYSRIEEAIIEEKRIKGGNRSDKLKMIEGQNLTWRDLWDDIQLW
jgi:putative endonuclease